MKPFECSPPDREDSRCALEAHRRSGPVRRVETRFVETMLMQQQTQTNRKIARGSDDFTYLRVNRFHHFLPDRFRVKCVQYCARWSVYLNPAWRVAACRRSLPLLDIPRRKRGQGCEGPEALAQLAGPSQGHHGYLRHEQHLVHARGTSAYGSKCWARLSSVGTRPGCLGACLLSPMKR